MKTIVDPSPLYYNGDLISTYLALPHLRLFVPFSSVNESLAAFDLSGQGRTLSNTGSAGIYIYNNLVPYADLNGTTQYFSRADEAGLRITGGLTMGLWANHDVINQTSSYIIASKYGAAGQRGYLLMTGNGSSSMARAVISGDGTAVVEANSGADLVTAAKWNFFVLRFNPSTEIALFWDGKKYTNTTSIPAAIFASNSAFILGTYGLILSLFDGRISCPFVCAAVLPDDAVTWVYERTRKHFA
jgi:hypothetical protein